MLDCRTRKYANQIDSTAVPAINANHPVAYNLNRTPPAQQQGKTEKRKEQGQGKEDERQGHKEGGAGGWAREATETLYFRGHKLGKSHVLTQSHAGVGLAIVWGWGDVEQCDQPRVGTLRMNRVGY
eukprot:763803-Hanusia_phi.AAC.3